MKLLPRHDQVIIKRETPERMSAGGIVLPDTGRDKPVYGLVVEIGPNVVGLAKNDRVLFGKYSGSDIRFDNEEFTIMRDEDICAVIGE